MTSKRRVVLGVTGSIAAYKAAELVRLLKKAGVDVHVILTRSGAQFITPMTLGTLSGNPVTTDMFGESTGGPYIDWGRAEESGGPEREPGIRHIQASRASQLIVVAPATGNILGKVAHGIADDALSTAILASSAPVLFAPAMNTLMWMNPAVQDNVKLLRRRGYLFIEPGSGDLACGEVGAGRMAEPEEITGEILKLLSSAAEGPRLLVTAGRTEEPVDPVRFLSNRSSGRMGFAVAEAGRDLGYRVTVIAGPTAAAVPPGVEVVRVRTAAEMDREVRNRHKEHEVLVMAAAVADYRPRKAAPGKIPGGQAGLSLALVPTRDVLSAVSRERKGKITVGFALETGQELKRARAKLATKGCDLLVLNNPLRPGSEFGGETNEVTFLFRGGRAESMPRMTKLEVGREILRRVEEIRAGGR
jgi:phosphopantothenoylcysteine decarboxylase/phosphopantothenate--cysteine ligase